MTFAFTWVSMSQFAAVSVPCVSLATVQGIVHGVYFGLGNGIGHLIGGLTIDAYGAPATFYATSVFVVLWLLLFVVCQKVCPPSMAYSCYASAPPVGRRHQAMLLSDVYLTSVAYTGRNSRTEKPRKTKIGTVYG